MLFFHHVTSNWIVLLAVALASTVCTTPLLVDGQLTPESSRNLKKRGNQPPGPSTCPLAPEYGPVEDLVVHSDGTIVGCLDTREKYCGENFRFLTEGETCDGNERQVRWNQVGEQGPPGPQGMQGPPGPQGMAGMNGIDGSSCTVATASTGGVISCSDGTTATIMNGSTGPEGPAGQGCTIVGTTLVCGSDSFELPDGTSGGGCRLETPSFGGPETTLVCGEASVTLTGAATPCFSDTSRFEDCGRGYVTDQFTGLVWLKRTDCTLDTQGTGHANANAAALLLEDFECGLSDRSKPGDWRLPTEAEILTILKPTCPFPSLPGVDGTGCQDVNDLTPPFKFGQDSTSNQIRPTSTIDSTDPTQRRNFNLNDGTVFSAPRNSGVKEPFWAVRANLK